MSARNRSTGPAMGQLLPSFALGQGVLNRSSPVPQIPKKPTTCSTATLLIIQLTRQPPRHLASGPGVREGAKLTRIAPLTRTLGYRILLFAGECRLFCCRAAFRAGFSTACRKTSWRQGTVAFAESIDCRCSFALMLVRRYSRLDVAAQTRSEQRFHDCISSLHTSNRC